MIGTLFLATVASLGTAREEIPFGSGADARFYDFCPYTDSCTFTIANGPAWLSVYGYGRVYGTPHHADIGPFRVDITATDETGATLTVPAQGQVEAITVAPWWPSDPVVLRTVHVGDRVAELFTRISGGQTGYDRYEMIGAPAWLTLNGNYLHGVPTAADVGEVAFTVRVVGPTGLFDEATAQLTVQP